MAMNTYLIVCEETNASAIIDPGADAQAILENARDTRIEKILLTHAHEDHVGALEEVKAAYRRSGLSTHLARPILIWVMGEFLWGTRSS
jgi:glyoxylase-like metal-dependent hydrolase (beta-lactamase superfamily II)